MNGQDAAQTAQSASTAGSILFCRQIFAVDTETHKLMRWLYTLLFYLSIPLVLSRLLWRGRKAPAYRRRWGERFGFFPALPEGPLIWVHAVSVGESIAAAPMIKALMAREPRHRILVTTTTPTGSEQVRKLFGDSVFHVYAPYDLPDCIARFLKRTRPHCLIIMETELWPNMVAICRRRGIPVILANGRLSQKSADGYGRVSALMKPLFGDLGAAAVQHEDDARRMQSLGLAVERTFITGNIKFDLSLSEELRKRAARLREGIMETGQRCVWIAASTHRGEDEQILQAFGRARQQVPALFLILVPRHPERFDEVADACQKRGYRTVRRSAAAAVDADTDILLGDTMGELLLLFGAADLAFVGGSLVPVGGHNLMEPAAWGLPILTGPHLFNFAEASGLLRDAGAMIVVGDQEELGEKVAELAATETVRQEMGKQALAVANANRGALQKLLDVIERTLRDQPEKSDGLRRATCSD